MPLTISKEQSGVETSGCGPRRYESGGLQAADRIALLGESRDNGVGSGRDPLRNLRIADLVGGEEGFCTD